MIRCDVLPVVAACVLTTLSLSTLARAERTLNYGLNAVPAPREVVIDGDLGEWDRSGEIVCCKDVEALMDIESARVSAMWDDEALYVGIVWRDATPMQNKVDPATMAGNGWRSDCLQLRCNMDGFISHVDCWYYTAGARPAMSTSYQDFRDRSNKPHTTDRPKFPERLGARQAFRLAEDGDGYVQEVKIPWAVVTKDRKRPPDDADLRLGVELFWGDVTADGWPKSRIADNVFEGHTKTDFFWTNVPAWGRLILAKRNNLTLPAPAWMKTAKSEPAGAVPVTFTLPKESYVTIALEDASGNRVKSLVGGVKFPAGENTVWWSGLDDRNGLLPPGEYRWKGLYRDRVSVTWMMSFYQPNERRPWKNAEGTGAWGPDHGNILAAAAGEGKVFLGGLGAEAGIPMFAVDERGAKAWSAQSGEPDRLAYADGTVYGHTSRRDSNWLGITPRGVMAFEAATGKWLDLPGPDGRPTKRRPLLGEQETAAGLAADSKGIYLSVAGASEVRSFDRTTFRELRRYRVDGAGELCATPDGSVLVATKSALVELAPGSGDVTTLAEGDFAAARALAADSAGQIYVALGKPHHQVHVYRRRGPSARLAWKLGREGGRRRQGRYEPGEGFVEPCGLAIDSAGRLWVVEDYQHPKRLSVWRGRRWVTDFIGDTGYGGGGVINPLDPSEAFYRDMRFEIDLDRGTWKLTHVGLLMPEGADRLGIATRSGDHATGGDVDAEYAMAHDGRAYIHKCRGTRHIYRKRRDGRWALCVFVDPRRKIAWMDRNDDCRVQDSEIARGRDGEDWGHTDYWGMRPSGRLDLYFSRGVDRPGLRLRATGVTPGGTPLYDFTRFEPMAGECMNGIGLADGTYNSGCAGERGDYFSEMRKIHPSGVAQRTFWYRGANTGRWAARMPAPGVVLYPFQAHGVARVARVGEVVCWVSDFGQRYLFTDDMLYVDQLFADSRAARESWPGEPERGFVADAMSPGQESFHGFFTGLDDGRFVLTTGFTDCRVFEVNGLHSLRRMTGSVELKGEHLAAARRIREFRLGGGRQRGKITVPRLAAAPRIDGRPDEWAGGESAAITVDADRGGEVYAAFDDGQLFVTWRVKGVKSFANAAQDWRLAFKGGNAVDVMYRAPGAGLDEAKTRDGDVRVLIARIDGRPRAVLYRPVSRTKRPHTFDAFEGAGRANAVRMDEVRLADEVTVAARPTAGGYVVEAAIPWAALGGRPQGGSEARVDFGVLFGDPSGSRTMVRAYWENSDTNIVSDIPSEAALKPGNWGVAVFGW